MPAPELPSRNEPGKGLQVGKTNVRPAAETNTGVEVTPVTPGKIVIGGGVENTDGAKVAFDQKELKAFFDGIKNGEFDFPKE